MSFGLGASADEAGPPRRAGVNAGRPTATHSAAMAAILNLDMRVSPRDKTAPSLPTLAQRHRAARELYQERGIKPDPILHVPKFQSRVRAPAGARQSDVKESFQVMDAAQYFRSARPCWFLICST